MFEDEAQTTFRQHLPSSSLTVFILVTGMMLGLVVWSLIWAPRTRAAAEDRDFRGQLQTELRSLMGGVPLAPAEARAGAGFRVAEVQTAPNRSWKLLMFILLIGAAITAWATINHYVASTVEIDDSDPPMPAEVPRPKPTVTTSDWMKVAVRTSRDGIISLDSTGRIMAANPAAEALLGSGSGRLPGQKASDYLPELGMNPESLRQFSQVASATTVTANKKDGTSQSLRLALQRVSDNADTHFVAAFFRPEPAAVAEPAVKPAIAVQQVASTQVAVAEVSPAVSTRVAAALREVNQDALHDLENQVVMLGGYSELVVSALDQQHPAMADAEAVSRAAARAGLLCHEVARISHPYPRTLDLNEFVVAVAGPLARVLSEGCEVKGLRGSFAVEVWADPDLLERALCSLAWRTQELSGGLRRVTISLANGRLDLRMIPMGGSSAATPAVFDALQAVDWIEAQSGTIEMEEHSETGVRFRIWLPEAAQARQPSARKQVQPGAKSHAAD